MLRSAFLWLSEHRGIFEFVKRNGVARIAGWTRDIAVAASNALNAAGIKVSLDLLGESVANEAETRRARDEVIATVDAIARHAIKGGVSVKLTQLGLDIDEGLCRENMRSILEHAGNHAVFIRIDMESSEYTERTLRMFCDHLQAEFNERTGVVIQSYLRRSERDVADLMARGASVRLCKGAYAEPASVAFQGRAEVGASFVRLMEQLLLEGRHPAIATHDDELITRTEEFAARHGVPRDRFEFQLLYGVRRDLQERLRREGYMVRVYIPFGSAWYPYLMRRLAERPANVAFMVASMFKESVSRR
jgi:proline dehydrogenase